MGRRCQSFLQFPGPAKPWPRKARSRMPTELKLPRRRRPNRDQRRQRLREPPRARRSRRRNAKSPKLFGEMGPAHHSGDVDHNRDHNDNNDNNDNDNNDDEGSIGLTPGARAEAFLHHERRAAPGRQRIALKSDDFMAEASKPLWSSSGRGDLAIMKRLGKVSVMADTLENHPAYQALTEGGQCKCLHCFKRSGFFDKAEGRVPIMMYARPCHEHQFLHPTSYDVGQWFLDWVDLQRMYIHNPRGGLAVLWVDMSLIGAIDVQLLRQDHKEDRSAGIDAYAFCNKVADLTRQHPDLKAKVVIAHTHVAMAMKWEPYKFAHLNERQAESESSMKIDTGIQTEIPIHPHGMVDFRRRGLRDLPRGPLIIAIPVSSTSRITLNVVDRVAEEPYIEERRQAAPLLRRTDFSFVTGWGGGYVNEGMHLIDEEQPGELTTVFSEHEPESEAQSDGIVGSSMKPAETGGIGYVLEPPEGIVADGVIGDPAAVSMSGKVAVRNGEVRLAPRGDDPKKSKMCGHERDMHRRAMAMEADLHDGSCDGIGRQYHNIGPRDMLKGKLAGVEVSAKTLSNALRAVTDRHFKFSDEIGKVSEKARSRGVIDEIHERMLAAPDKYKSSKWSSDTFRAALTSAGLDQGTTLRKSGHVKPNEALGKQKPRLILEGGPRSVVTHLFDARVMEDLIFHTTFFEERSIKHTSLKGLCQRIRNLAERYDFTKSLLHSVVGHLLHACGLTRDALDARDNENLKAVIQREARLLVEEKIRESGGRGTSIFNYLTNMMAFLAAIILLAREKGLPEKSIKTMLSDFFQGKGDWYDIIAEDDDGEQFFSKGLLALLGYRNGDKFDKAKFGEEFFAQYRHLGLKIEPQGPDGEVPFSKALVSTQGRMEFCSKLFVYHKGVGAWMPKPKKTFIGSQVSFDVGASVHVAGMVKALSLMNNCQCCEIMFNYFAAMFRYRRSKAMNGDLEAAEKLLGDEAWSYYATNNEQLVSRGIDAQYHALGLARELCRTSDISQTVDKAFRQETGMNTQCQRSWCLSLADCDGDRAKALMASFLDAIKC
ncbi:hypothetical protein AK812_SmicGene42781 [Symbiodinium microadriaticum]|uniref:Uncharacterized protein n=1 Tax=Symbiodinium microadriaticum TaxID=2951 RepID=A0A1Q9C2P6_SYMMI|nr:hypothetical protein AK812_SmicGene42781 [Symbiodinium microadriaticum]